MKFKLAYNLNDFEEAAKLAIQSSQSLDRFQRKVTYYTFVYPRTCILTGLAIILSPILIAQISQAGNLILVIMSVSLMIFGTQIIYGATIARKKLINTYVIRHSQIESTDIEVTEEGIFAKNNTSEGVMKWQGFSRAVYNNTVILTYLNDFQTLVIPKRLFSTEDWNQLVDIIKSNIKDTKFT